MKNSCQRAVISGKKVISNAEDLYKYSTERLSKQNAEAKREFTFISSRDVNRERESNQAETVVGTRKLHCMQGLKKPGEVKIRKLSCFFNGCKQGEDCENLPYVEDWELKKIKLRKCILYEILKFNCN